MPNAAGTAYWALTDNENSVRDWITYGSLVDHIVYDPFGKVDTTHSTMPVGFAFGHNGVFYDPNTGLEYHNDPSSGRIGRWLMPSIQRWLSEDPLGLGPDANPYRDESNSPTNFTDPTGHENSTYALLEADHKLALDWRAQHHGEADPDWVREAEEAYGGYCDLVNAAAAKAHNDASRGKLGFDSPLDLSDPRVLKAWLRQQYHAEHIPLDGISGLIANKFSEAYSNAEIRGAILGNNAAATGGSEEDATNAAKAFWIADLIGLTGINNAAAGSDAATGDQLSTGDRWVQGITGAIQMATFGWNMTSGFKPNAADEGNLCTDSENGGCFVAGTLVDTEVGKRRIEEVQAGERVWACDLTSGKWMLCTVGEIYKTEYIGDLIAVEVAGKLIESTYHHPFWVVEGEALEARPTPDHVERAMVFGAIVPGRWVDAGDLRVGDVLLLKPDRRAAIQAIKTRRVVTDVYNFQVERLHNYAVGLTAALVHNNAICDSSMSPEEAAQNGLTERDPGWADRGSHETENHHPLMQGDSYSEYWENRGFGRDEVEGTTIPLETDIHRGIEESGWWAGEVTGRIADAEAAQGGQLLNRDQVWGIIVKIFNEHSSWLFP